MLVYMDNHPSGSTVVASKSADPLRLSPFAALRLHTEIWICRYNGSSIVARSIDLGQPVIFVSMNYR